MVVNIKAFMVLNLRLYWVDRTWSEYVFQKFFRQRITKQRTIDEQIFFYINKGFNKFFRSE
jgi:hypothetical protein